MSRFDRLLLGVAFFIITIMMVWATDGDIAIAFLTVPFALICIFYNPKNEPDRMEYIDQLWSDYREDNEPQMFDLKEDF